MGLAAAKASSINTSSKGGALQNEGVWGAKESRKRSCTNNRSRYLYVPGKRVFQRHRVSQTYLLFYSNSTSAPSLLCHPSIHYLATTFSVLQSAQRGCSQLGQVSVMMLILVSPQEHFLLGEPMYASRRWESGSHTQDQTKTDFRLLFEGGYHTTQYLVSKSGSLKFGLVKYRVR
jgi:hypothetical protein